MLYDEAPRADYDDLVASLVAAGADPEATRRECDVALRLRDLVARQRSREAELSALYQTAHDLTALRDVDAVLEAIVRRARQLLKADMTYLSLNDVDDGTGEGASYMKVTDGALTAEFEQLRLPLGTGLLGLVAQTGAPYFTADYQTDARFEHRRYIDAAVDGERIRAILGVPLLVEGRVIGALLATHRTVRPFPPEEVSLLTSFAAHAAVALENARLFAELDAAARRIGEQAAAVDRAAEAHDRLTALVLRGSPLDEVVEVLGQVLGHAVGVRDREGRRLAGPEPILVAEEVPVVAGSERLGCLVVLGDPDGDAHGQVLDPAERRILERGAVVVALVLLFARSEEAAEARLGGALIADLLRDPQDRAEVGRLRARAARHGVDLDGGCVVAVARLDGVEAEVAARAAVRAARASGGLVGVHDGQVVLVARADDGPVAVGEALARSVATTGGTATVGIAAGPPDALGSGLSAAYAEAARCAEVLVVLGRTGEVSDPAGLGVARLVLGGGGPEALTDFVEDVLGPVLAWDETRGSALCRTVEAWFAAGGSPSGAATRLHVHPNTVAQRLARVDELLGRGWREPARALDVQLALRVVALRGVAPGDVPSAHI
nr:GAF domain-containing protein [Nocardioides marinus]